MMEVVNGLSSKIKKNIVQQFYHFIVIILDRTPMDELRRESY